MRARLAVSDAPDRVLATRRRRTRPTVIDVSEWMQTAIVCALDTSRTARDDTNSSVEFFRRDRASQDRPRGVARARTGSSSRVSFFRGRPRGRFSPFSRVARRAVVAEQSTLRGRFRIEGRDQSGIDYPSPKVLPS